MTSHLPLLVWFSPAFPVGSFAYSHGLEWVHEAGDVANAAGLQDWLADLLKLGAARNDAILFAEAYRASVEPARLAEIAELAVALTGSAERRLETISQGDAFLRVAGASWPSAALHHLKQAWDGPVAYPVATGVASAGQGIPLRAALEAFLLSFMANLVSAALRLGIMGQTEGQQVTAALIPQVRRAAEQAESATLDDLGAAAFRSDIASLRHETQYTRLFRS
jgi:urease accessory protein